MTTSLADLRAYEAKILKALGDPVAETWYDDFRKRMRPVSELQSALAQVRAEISVHPDYTATQTRTRVRRHLPRAVSDL